MQSQSHGMSTDGEKLSIDASEDTAQDESLHAEEMVQKTIRLLDYAPQKGRDLFSHYFKPLIRLLNDLHSDNKNELKKSERRLEEVMRDQLAGEQQKHDQLIEAINDLKQHIEAKQEAIRDDIKALSQNSREVDDKLHGLLATFKELQENSRTALQEEQERFREILSKELEEQSHQWSNKLGDLDKQLETSLEKARLHVFKGLDMTRRRLSDMLSAGTTEIQDFVAAEAERIERKWTESLTEYETQRKEIEFALNEFQNSSTKAHGDSLSQFKLRSDSMISDIESAFKDFRIQFKEATETALRDKFDSYLSSLSTKQNEMFDRLVDENKNITKNLDDAFRLSSEHERSDIKSTMDKQFESVATLFDSVKQSQEEQFRSVHKALESFQQEDIKRINSEIKFLDRFLDRFQALAEEERKEISNLVREGGDQFVNAAERIEKAGIEEFKKRADNGELELKKVVGNFSEEASRRLKLIPQKFKAPALFYLVASLVVASTLITAIIVLWSVNRPIRIAEKQVAAVYSNEVPRTGPQQFEKTVLKNNIIAGNPNRKAVALTFDGGSEANVAHLVLDVLKERGIQSTFFLTGQFILDYPEVTRRILKEGHEVGNHTWDHPNFLELGLNRNETLKHVAKQLLETEKMFFAVTQQRLAPLWRAPYGAYNKSILNVAKGVGYTHVYWTDDTLDWVADSSSSLYHSRYAIADKMLASLGTEKGANGKIYLWHLGSEREPADRPHFELARVIDEMMKAGYTFERISDLVR